MKCGEVKSFGISYPQQVVSQRGRGERGERDQYNIMILMISLYVSCMWSSTVTVFTVLRMWMTKDRYGLGILYDGIFVFVSTKMV